VGLGCRWIKPLVIGEIIAWDNAGTISVRFGLPPDLQQRLCLAEADLNVLSQVGLIFFMFLIGLELNPKHLAVSSSLISRVFGAFSLGTQPRGAPLSLSFNARCLVHRLALFLRQLCPVQLPVLDYYRTTYKGRGDDADLYGGG